MSSDWKNILKTVAPWIGAAATGGVPALVGVAAKQLGEVFGTDVENTIEGIASAVNGASQEQLIKLREVDNQFKLNMQELGFKQITALETIAANDRDSARKRNIEMKDLTPSILSYLVVVAFGFVIYLLMTQDISVSESMRDVAMVLIGTLATAFGQVLNYYLGTSASSQLKDKTIHSFQSNSNIIK